MCPSNTEATRRQLRAALCLALPSDRHLNFGGGDGPVSPVSPKGCLHPEQGLLHREDSADSSQQAWHVQERAAQELCHGWTCPAKLQQQQRQQRVQQGRQQRQQQGWQQVQQTALQEELLVAELLASLEEGGTAALAAGPHIQPAAAATAALICGSSGCAAPLAAHTLERLFPGLHSLKLSCCAPGCTGRLTLSPGGGTCACTGRPCTCCVPVLSRLACSGGACTSGCQVEVLRAASPNDPGQGLVGPFVLALGRHLAQLLKEQHESMHSSIASRMRQKQRAEGAPTPPGRSSDAPSPGPSCPGAPFGHARPSGLAPADPRMLPISQEVAAA